MKARNGAYWKRSRVHKLETIICTKLFLATFVHTKKCKTSYIEMAGIFPKHDPHSYWVKYKPWFQTVAFFLGTAQCRNNWNPSHRINVFLTNASNSVFYILWTESSLVQKWFCIFLRFHCKMLHVWPHLKDNNCPQQFGWYTSKSNYIYKSNDWKRTFCYQMLTMTLLEKKWCDLYLLYLSSNPL
jgi:hypothetical protein